jgi:F0F1-type ATP synthase assembly protein I
MSWFSAIRDIFSKTEVTEETFEYESIDSYLAKQAAREALGDKDDVAYKCDQIIDATYHVDELRVEYDMVTSYFTDIQTIENLPEEVRAEITATAKKISMLESETKEFLHSDDRISDVDFRMIQGLEKNLTEIFSQLKELEDMDMKIKKDLKNLEIEKNTQEYIQDNVEDQQHRLRMFMIVLGGTSAFLILVLAILGIVMQANVMIPILLIVLVVMGMTAFSVVTFHKLTYQYKLAQKKENKAISLTNKVKIKYVNNTSTLEYLYNKYNIKNLRELEYLYDQYTIMVEEVRKYQKNSGDLREYSDALSKLLFNHGIKDPDIWIKQTPALVDPREMVEVKHSLNVRRQKLREQIAYNESLRVEGLKDIEELLKKDPDLREQVRKELEVYQINV